jgi:S-adenosylmethionine synthetase
VTICFHSDGFTNVEELPFEVVERKGVGHPDTLCDAIAERTSQLYSQFCIQSFGGVAHHWFDKVILLGGEAEIGFGEGRLTRPYTLMLGGKAATRVGEAEIPIAEIFRAAAGEILMRELRGFDVEQNLDTKVLITDHKGPGQQSSRYRPKVVEDLVKLDSINGVSNDCNLCVAFAPFSSLERLVLESEKFLNSPAYRAKNPDTGSDIKVVGLRREKSVELTINMPLLANYIFSHSSYLHRLSECQEDVAGHVRSFYDGNVDIVINPEKDSGRAYLTVTGSVADTGDIGVVGRGNRSNGLITPCRPMSIEAAAGKNPIDHTGKLYSSLASQFAKYIHNVTKEPATVFITTFKEVPLSTPSAVDVFCKTIDPNFFKECKQWMDEYIIDIGKLSANYIENGSAFW